MGARGLMKMMVAVEGFLTVVGGLTRIKSRVSASNIYKNQWIL